MATPLQDDESQPCSAVRAHVVEEFCKLCNWAYEAWITHRILFDDNPNVESLMQSKYGHFFARLSIMTHEYSLHQIVKLHDPAAPRNRTNLTIEYMVKCGGWDQTMASTLRQLQGQLERFAEAIKLARNKILSHNDLSVILNAGALGHFAQDEDRRYFEVLQEFVNLVHDRVLGGPYPFNDIAKNDAHILLEGVADEREA